MDCAYTNFGRTVENFTLDELMVNISHHSDVPKHDHDVGRGKGVAERIEAEDARSTNHLQNGSYGEIHRRTLGDVVRSP
jgi:hypothetical protein